ncbi:cupin domain-containing protein [Kytococcus schroeteri]|uniref:cupin domain-containing protein n=1 Tax=Kytococcus schroeteri TaxID=138300 RepID=UPI001142063B|nr:cupin domain-containing protein [Kytococcus schroeteri]
MSTPAAGSAPASQDRPALRRLLHTDPADFAGRSWGTRPLHVTAAERGGDDFADLFSLEAVDELLTHRALRTPFLRMAKEGQTLPESRFTRGGGTGAGASDQVDEDRVRSLFAGGSTIVLQGLHRTWRPIAEFARRLGEDLRHPVQVNAYITPPQNQGFSAHYDVHDVFVLQVHGTKHWTLHEPVIEHPLRDQPWDTVREQVAHRTAHEDPVVDTVLEPGDVLYLPRGTIHAAAALGGISAHLTIGVHTWTPDHVAGAALEAARARLRQEPALRANLPLGARPDDAAVVGPTLEQLRGALHEAIDSLDAAALARAFRTQVRATRRPDPAPPLAQLAAAEGLGTASTVALRGGLELGDDPARPDRLHTRLGWFDLDEDARAVVTALQDGPHRTDALPAPLTVVQDLVRRGLVEVQP